MLETSLTAKNQGWQSGIYFLFNVYFTSTFILMATRANKLIRRTGNEWFTQNGKIPETFEKYNKTTCTIGTQTKYIYRLVT